MRGARARDIMPRAKARRYLICCLMFEFTARAMPCFMPAARSAEGHLRCCHYAAAFADATPAADAAAIFATLMLDTIAARRCFMAFSLICRFSYVAATPRHYERVATCRPYADATLIRRAIAGFACAAFSFSFFAKGIRYFFIDILSPCFRLLITLKNRHTAAADAMLPMPPRFRPSRRVIFLFWLIR